MNEYTDIQLKRVLVKMLPDKLEIARWKLEPRETLWDKVEGRSVRDTELLHLCWLVETQKVPEEQWMHYASSLGSVAASWQHRITTLAALLGIEI